MSTIALLSDFGTDDWFVGSMKGAILDINPAASIVDISHHINQGSIRAAAISLLSSYRSFPKKTIFVVVVDPGVGSKLKDWNTFSWPEVEVSKDGIHGEIIYIDHFGNAFTNITADALRNYDPDSMYIFK